MRFNCLICGKGGQGVITLNRTIGNILSLLGYKVISAETHGMAMRGGSVSTFLKCGEFKSAGFGYNQAEYIISTDYDEYLNNKHYLKNDGYYIVNTEKNNKSNKGVFFDATKSSLKIFESPKYANYFLLFIFFGLLGKIYLIDVKNILINQKLLDENKYTLILKELKNVI